MIHSRKSSSVFTTFLLLIAVQVYALDDWQPLPTGEVTRIAIGSCAKQWEAQPIWNTVAELNPDLFLFTGDAIYGDWHGEKPFIPTRESLEADWEKLALNPDFAEVRTQVPFMATWDNHDYGSHNGGVDFEQKEMTRKVFLDFFDEPKYSERRKTPGIYDAKIFGPPGRRVQIILLDPRWFRSSFKKDERSAEQLKAIGKVGKYAPNTDSNATILGDIQWQWLEEQLKKPAELRLVVSSTQIIPDQKGMDEWGAFPRERQRLFDLVKSSRAEGVILVSGNVHFSEASKIDNGDYPLYEITASGMTHVNPVYAAAANKYRVAGPYVDHNVGLIEIDWDAKPSPQITLKVIGRDEKNGFEHPVQHSSLQQPATIVCKDPRPEMCTMDYRPVCAAKSDGSQATYSNGCGACSDPEVLEYRQGECES